MEERTGNPSNLACGDFSSHAASAGGKPAYGKCFCRPLSDRVFGSGPGSQLSAYFSYLDALQGNVPWAALDLETFVPGDEARGRKSKKNEPRKGTALDLQVARIRLVSLTVQGTRNRGH